MRLSGIQRNLLPALLITVSAMFGGSAMAYDDVASGALVERVGLTVQWFSHTGIGANGRLVDWHLNVNEDASTTYFTISSGKYRESFSQNKLNTFGKPMGIDGSVAFAEIRKEILMAEFANEGFKDREIKIEQYSLPKPRSTRLPVAVTFGRLMEIQENSLDKQYR